MPDTTIQAAQGLADIIKWVFAFALGILGFNIRSTSKKVDDHEKNHISRDEFSDTVRIIRKENREDFKALHEKIDRMMAK